MSLINKHKWGNCSQCENTDCAVIKRGKNLFCLSCAKTNSNKQQIERATEKNKIRSLYSVQDKTKSELDKWFLSTRKKLTGVCQCGCGNKSQKNDDTWYKASCCHIFPKSKFNSVRTHPLNFVERSFFGGCHSIFDDTSMNRWVGLADWADIREKFKELSQELTDEERSTKFYSQLEGLVYNN